MTELNDAIVLASRVLDRPSAGPDDELAILSRQLIRQVERLHWIKTRLLEGRTSEALAALDNLPLTPPAA